VVNSSGYPENDYFKVKNMQLNYCCEEEGFLLIKLLLKELNFFLLS
jgi:hypothetical protein